MMDNVTHSYQTNDALIYDLIHRGIVFEADEDMDFPAINCNDFFFYASAYTVDIEPVDHYFLELAIDQCDLNKYVGTLLFACRKEKMRPLKAYKKNLQFAPYWHLFKECEPSWFSKLWAKLFVSEKTENGQD